MLRCLILLNVLVLPVFDVATPAGLIKEEYIHDCIQMDLPPGMPLSDHQTSLKLPPPDHYGQALPPPQMSAEPHGPPPVNRCANLPISPKGQLLYSKFDQDGGGGGGSHISEPFLCVLPAVSVNMLPRGGHADGALQTASPQAQVMTQPPPPATPPQVPPQQQTGQQTSQQPSIPASHSQSQNNYSSTKHPQSQAAFHGECTPTCQAHTSPSWEGQNSPRTSKEHRWGRPNPPELLVLLSCCSVPQLPA